MSERLLRLGVPPEYFGHAKHFEGVFRNLGWSQSQIDAAIKWGAEFKGKPADIYPQFSHLAEQHGIQDVDIDLAVSWRDQVAEQGIDNMPKVEAPATSRDDDLRRLAEIRADMRKPKGDGQYWRDEAMRDEHLEILERLGDAADDPTPPPVYRGTPQEGDAGRKAEIQALMRSDRDAYFRNEAVQAEYMAILRREQSPESRLEEIRQMRTADPNGYDQNHDLQREELSLINRTQGGPDGSAQEY